jgi:hypothetical protein
MLWWCFSVSGGGVSASVGGAGAPLWSLSHCRATGWATARRQLQVPVLTYSRLPCAFHSTISLPRYRLNNCLPPTPGNDLFTLTNYHVRSIRLSHCRATVTAYSRLQITTCVPLDYLTAALQAERLRAANSRYYWLTLAYHVRSIQLSHFRATYSLTNYRVLFEYLTTALQAARCQLQVQTVRHLIIKDCFSGTSVTCRLCSLMGITSALSPIFFGYYSSYKKITWINYCIFLIWFQIFLFESTGFFENF